jgi:hypothetical protein
VNQRSVVSPWRKLALIAAATGGAFWPRPRALADPSPLPAVAFLVDAAASTAQGPAGSRTRRVQQRSFDESMEWACGLYARLLEQDQRAMH